MPKPRITETDLCRQAKRIGTSTAEIETFLEVEARNSGFDSQDRPVILFERHWFHKLTRGKYSEKHPDISNPRPGGYGKSGEQYARFSKAFALDPQAAMKSTSWGIGQVMGFNHLICGYPTVDAFVDAMKESEGKQLDAAISFIVHNGLDDELRRHDWKGFARGYNGSNYEINDYDGKLAKAFQKFNKRKINCSQLSAAVPDIDPQSNGAVSDATSNPLESDSPIQPPNDHKEVKAEIAPDGGVKMSSTEGPSPPKERIAIVKSKPKTWAQAIVAKITAAVSGNALFQWIWGQQDKITGLSVPNAVWIIVSLTIAIGFLLWIVYEIIAVYRSNKYQENIDALLVKENSTADNLVQLIPADEVDLYRTRGFKIITRGESVAVQK